MNSRLQCFSQWSKKEGGRRRATSENEDGDGDGAWIDGGGDKRYWLSAESLILVHDYE